MGSPPHHHGAEKSGFLSSGFDQMDGGIGRSAIKAATTKAGSLAPEPGPPPLRL
jgi:hypothetical protein